MPDSSLHINLSTVSANSSDYVIIAQEPRCKDVGRTSKLQGVLAISSMIFGGQLPVPNCGGLAGFDTPVYVYPSRKTLRFTFALSHGDFKPGVSATMTREEIVSCGFKDVSTLDYPPSGLVSLAWIGKCYDATGRVTSSPAFTINGRSIVFSGKVYGSLRARYSVYRVTHNVRIEEREDSLENNFECIAYCRWDGGIVYEDIKAPSGYDETKGNCGNGIYSGEGPINGGSGSAEICTPSRAGGTYPTAVKADRITTIDYCQQSVVSDKITESVESGKEPGEECSDGPITTN